MILVIGGKNSGKSRFAEGLAVNGGKDRRYYLATMKVCDEAGRKRIKRHRKQREGKGFITIELQYGIDRAIQMMDEPENSVVLLECVANLVGNELYDNPEREWHRGCLNENCVMEDAGCELFADAVLKDICSLEERAGLLIAVSSEYHVNEDMNKDVDECTRMYIELLDRVNTRLIECADRVYRM